MRKVQAGPVSSTAQSFQNEGIVTSLRQEADRLEREAVRAIDKGELVFAGGFYETLKYAWPLLRQAADEIEVLRIALREEMAWDMGGVPENEWMRRTRLLRESV